MQPRLFVNGQEVVSRCPRWHRLADRSDTCLRYWLAEIPPDRNRHLDLGLAGWALFTDVD